MSIVKRTNRKEMVESGTLLKDRRGLSTVEYVIILALIAIVTVGIWRKFGDSLYKAIEAGKIQVDGLPKETRE